MTDHAHETDEWPALRPNPTVKVVPSEPATVKRVPADPPAFPTDAAEVRGQIVTKAADHLFAALDEFTEGVRWLELVEPGTLDRWREVRVRMSGLCDHADEMVRLGTPDA